MGRAVPQAFGHQNRNGPLGHDLAEHLVEHDQVQGGTFARYVTTHEIIEEDGKSDVQTPSTRVCDFGDRQVAVAQIESIAPAALAVGGGKVVAPIDLVI